MRRLKLGAAAIGLLAIGGAAGGAIGQALRPPIEMAPIHSVAIRNLGTAQGIVTIKGRVAESFGGNRVIDDGTGRTLIDAGPRADGGTLAPPGAVVAVQGRFDRGVFHPSFLVDPTGTVTPLGHHPGPHGHPGPDGDAPHGPDPVPPAPAAPAATPA
jgi:hypothetical protein